jgi:DNA-binding NarL/FixJ family response regulator
MAPILVADPDDADRAFIGRVLERAGFRAESVARGDEALDAAHRERPALAVLEVPLPGISGYEVCRTLREEFGEDGVRILFVSATRQEPWDRLAGLHLGADDYVGKPLSAEELLARVKALVRRAPDPPQPRPQEELTDREREVLRLLAAGFDQGRIARELFITPKTVGKHIEHILRKLDVHSRAEAVAVAYRRGLAPPVRVTT